MRRQRLWAVLFFLVTVLGKCTAADMPPGRVQHGSCSMAVQQAVLAAADSQFFQSLENLVGSIHFHEPDQRILVYDLGMTSQQLNRVRSWENTEAFRFPFENFPPHVRDLTNFAWKACVIQLAVQQTGCVVYLDAGMELRQPLSILQDKLLRRGQWFVAATMGTYQARVGYAVHPAQISELGLTDAVKEKVSLAANMQGWCDNTSAWNMLFLPWWNCCLRLECIMPPGSNKDNHRFDQSALSMILHAANDYRIAARQETFFVEQSTTFWLSSSMLHASQAQLLENPDFTLPGLMFFARRRKFPKPFTPFVRTHNSAGSDNKPARGPSGNFDLGGTRSETTFRGTRETGNLPRVVISVSKEDYEAVINLISSLQTHSPRHSAAVVVDVDRPSLDQGLAQNLEDICDVSFVAAPPHTLKASHRSAEAGSLSAAMLALGVSLTLQECSLWLHPWLEAQQAMDPLLAFLGEAAVVATSFDDPSAFQCDSLASQGSIFAISKGLFAACRGSPLHRFLTEIQGFEGEPLLEQQLCHLASTVPGFVARGGGEGLLSRPSANHVPTSAVVVWQLQHRHYKRARTCRVTRAPGCAVDQDKDAVPQDRQTGRQVCFVFSGYALSRGEDLESLVALHALRAVGAEDDHCLVDKTNILSLQSQPPTVVLFTGWFGTPTLPLGEWPPPPNILAIPISIHLSPRLKLRLVTHAADRAWFRARQPIGARDWGTWKSLHAMGIEVFFSGPLSAILTSLRDASQVPSGVALAVDASEEQANAARANAAKFSWVNTTCAMTQQDIQQWPLDRMQQAEQFLDSLARADFVLTSRLQTYLSCRALGIPVSADFGLAADPSRLEGIEDITENELREMGEKLMMALTLAYPVFNQVAPGDCDPSHLFSRIYTEWKRIVHTIFPASAFDGSALKKTAFRESEPGETPRGQTAATTSYDRYPRVFALAARIAPQVPKPRILSFGCSEGLEPLGLGMLYFETAHIYGTDLGKHTVRLAKENCKALSGRSTFFESTPELLLEHGPYHVVFAMSVLCRHPLSAEELEQQYSFSMFNQTVHLLASLVHSGGLLVIYNANYQFADTEASADFHEVPLPTDANYTGEDASCGFMPIYTKTPNAFAARQPRSCIFRKRAR